MNDKLINTSNRDNFNVDNDELMNKGNLKMRTFTVLDHVRLVTPKEAEEQKLPVNATEREEMEWMFCENSSIFCF